MASFCCHRFHHCASSLLSSSVTVSSCLLRDVSLNANVGSLRLMWSWILLRECLKVLCCQCFVTNRPAHVWLFSIASITQPGAVLSRRESGQRRCCHREKVDKSRSVIQDCHLLNHVSANVRDTSGEEADMQGVAFVILCLDPRDSFTIVFCSIHDGCCISVISSTNKSTTTSSS